MKNDCRYFLKLLAFVSLLLIFPPSLKADEYNIPSSLRLTIDREEKAVPIVCYFSEPHAKKFPILILCEGSSSRGNLRSVFRIHEEFLERIRSLQIALLTVEQWGIDGNQVDEEQFFEHYSCSQRLKDHLQMIKYLEEHPPTGWNGKFIFIGGSEGGRLVTDLTTLCPNTVATINWVGAGDWNWADQLWQFFDDLKQRSLWFRLYDIAPWLPFSSDIPQTRQEYDALVQHIICNPTPHQSMGGMTYFYHADAFQRPPLDYCKIRSPFLVVKGTEDSDIASCDQFVQKATLAGAPITYYRIDGMDHSIRNRPDVIDRSFEWLKEQL